MQLGINDYHIYTRQDVQDLVRSFHYEENKDRYNKIYQELEEIKPRDPHGGLDQNLTKKEILDYMKHKMLCFYNPKIVGELFNLIGLDQNSTITRFF